ncbi:MAG TPA: pectinesterase family protein [Chthoniobacter sp.]|nr:pectinesterase family protein [Chthoniobacter sp.]
MKYRHLAILLVLGFIILEDSTAQLAAADADSVTVAADGSGQYKTVQEAVTAAPNDRETRFTIHIKPGVYREVVVVPKNKPHLAFVGGSAENTKITFDNGANTTGPDSKPLGTFKTQTVQIEADDFHAENITFENGADRRKLGQAIALFTNGDRLVFRKCRILGAQDTLFARAGRQYFEECYIEGEVDYIFGGAVAWFEKCTIHSKSDGVITAASTDAAEPYGYVFSNCTITSSPSAKFDLGRPWLPNASVNFLNCVMPAGVSPNGWGNFGNAANEKTARYGEYGSKSPDAKPIDVARRAPWTKQLTAEQASKITVAEVFRKAHEPWDPTKSSAEQSSQAIRLTAKAAKIVGSNAKLNDAGTLGWWTNIDTSFEWTATLEPGVYTVGVSYALAPDQGTTDLVIRVGDKALASTVAPTVYWDDYKAASFGEVTIDKTSQVTISLAATAHKGRFLGDIKSVSLAKK